MILETVLLALSVGASTPPADSLLSVDSAFVELRKGGYTILWRHPATDQTNPDKPGFPNTERYQQRNLSDRGVAEAKAIGLILKNRGIPIGEVLASPMFRTRETAEYAFGRVTVAPLLLSMQASPDERRLITAQPAAGTNRVLITHHFVIERHAPGIKPGDVAEGEAVVVRASGDQLRTIAIIKMKDWYRLHEQDGGAPAPPGGNAAGGPQASATPPRWTDAPMALPALLETPKTAAVAEYLRAYNTGDPARMRQFFERAAVPNPERPIEKRLESYEGLKKELGSISIVSAETPSANQVVVKTQSSTGKASTITFTLEAASPYRVAGISFLTGGG